MTMKKWMAVVVFAAVGAGALVWGFWPTGWTSDERALTPWADTERARVHAPDMVKGVHNQQDMYLLEFRSPEQEKPVRLLVDVGDEPGMRDHGLPYLKRLGVGHLDRVYITHPHKDHYGGLALLLDSGVTIGQLVMNRPLKAKCDTERPWGCDWDHIEQTLELARARGVPHVELFVDDPQQPAVLWTQEGVDLSLVLAPRPEHPVMGLVDINDMSMVMRLQVSGVVHWFTGDMNVAAGDFLLLELGQKLKGDVLKVPHHGAESTVTNAFLEAVAPQRSWVPSPANLWCSQRSQRMRDWLEGQGVQNHVMGVQGDVWVRYFSDREPLWFSDRPATQTCLSEPVPTNSQKPEWAEAPHAVDRLEAQTWAQGPVLQVQGWLAPPNAASGHGARTGVALVNVETGGLTVWGAHAQARPDVAEHFKHLKLDPNTLGLLAFLPFKGVPQGRYEVALHWQDGGQFKFKKTGRTVTWGSNGLVVD